MRNRGVRKANATDVVFDAGIQGDAFPRIEIHADGTIWTGDGTEAPPDQLGATGPPGVPGTPVATGANVSADLTWTAASPGGAPITAYVITPYIGATAQATTTVGNVLAANVTGLTNGLAYTFRVHAVNGIGAGGDSAASNSVTPAPTAPGVPTIGTATAGNAQATANWTAPASNGGSAITGYQVKTYDGSGTLVDTDTVGVVLTFLETGLTNGSDYKFKVAAINTVGPGAQSGFSNTVTPAAAPFSPADLGSKLKVWLEADDLSAGAVSAWSSISPATFNASQGTGGAQPTCVAADINGHNAVVFDGVNDFLTLGTAKIIGEAAGDEFTIFYVVKIPAASAGWIIARDDNALGRDFAFGKSGSQAPLLTIAGNVGLAGNAVSDNYEYHTLDGTAGSTHQNYVNGVAGQGGSLGASGVTATGPTTIAARSYSGAEGYSGMRLAALYVCSTRCTTGERNSMHAYIAARFGL